MFSKVDVKLLALAGFIFLVFFGLVFAARSESNKSIETKINKDQVVVEKITYCDKTYSVKEWKKINGSKSLWQGKCPEGVFLNG